MALQLNRSGKDTSAASKSGTGKSAKAAPVTAHPLFPAVVALWFGALFGLGSLAVRVGLLEALVLATRIDTLIPAAAPPLGISARILLALTLAALGALLGAGIARRIAAPKPVIHERKRKAALSPEESLNLRSRDAHPDAPARRPLSINDALGDTGDAGAENDQTAADPLAGRRRSALAIETDDTFELHELAPLPGGYPQIGLSAADPVADFNRAPLELGDYAEANEQRQAVPSETPALDWHSPAVSADFAPQVFHAGGPRAADVLPNFSPPSDAVAGRQVFGMAQPQPDEVLDQLGITDAEFEPLPTAEMSFDTPGDPHFADLDPRDPVQAGINQAGNDQAGTVSEPAPAIDAADPATMPMTDLAQRLAESMQRRRDRTARAEQMAQAEQVARAEQMARAAHVVVASAAEPGLSAPEVPSARAELATSGSTQPAQPAGFKLVGVVAEAGAVPRFTHPNEIPAPVAAPLPAALPAAVPAGLRPLSFDALTDDDDELGRFLPPRSFPGIGLAERQAGSPALAPFAAPPASADGADGDLASTDKFSSLLDLNRSAEPRQSFVRIDTADEPAAAIEPVVIFPGQIARPATALAAPTSFDPAEASFRQFDSPASADAGQAVAAATAIPHDPAETERALRAALANLQRMSGAA